VPTGAPNSAGARRPARSDSSRLNQLTAYKAGASVARYLPGSVAGAIGTTVGFAVARVQRDKRRMVARHLRRAMGPDLTPGQVGRAVDGAFDSYAHYWVDSFRLPGLTTAQVDAGFWADGYERIPDALADGNGVILALPHLGGWEWAGRWIADRPHPITAVVEPLAPPEVFDWFRDLRSSLGMTVVPLGPTAGATVLRALRANHVVCLLSDRDLQGGGVPVDFFGEKTTLPAGPATLAIRTGAPILPTAVYFTPERDGHFGLVRPPIPIVRTGRLRDDVAAVTQALAFELEGLIRRAPEQWHLFQPNWPSDPGYQPR
jgi:lauroyl/myristoyl acyltransferase